ncbi:MAG: VanZ family protein [Vagococcus sp.]
MANVSTINSLFYILRGFFNLLLLLPLGIYLRYFFKDKRKWYIALIISFSVTLFFELSQLTAMFGYYAYPYRLFDVDDLLMNSLGAMIGFFLAPLLLWLIPSRDNINERDKQFSHNQLASYGAQLIELIVTVSISKMLATSISLLIMKDTPFFLIQTVTLFFFSVLMPYFFKGKTVGGMLVRLRLTSSLDKSFFMSLITRFLIIYIPSMMGLFTSFINQFSNENIYVLSLQIGFLLFSLLFWLFIGFDILKKWLKKYPEPYFNHYASIEAIRYIHNAKP